MEGYLFRQNTTSANGETDVTAGVIDLSVGSLSGACVITSTFKFAWVILLTGDSQGHFRAQKRVQFFP
jgi:hypothetical protein